MPVSTSLSWLLPAPVAWLALALGAPGCTRLGDDLRPRPADAAPPDAFVIAPDAVVITPDAAVVDAGPSDAAAAALGLIRQPVETSRVCSGCGKSSRRGEENQPNGHPPGTP